MTFPSADLAERVKGALNVAALLQVIGEKKDPRVVSTYGGVAGIVVTT